MWYPAGAAPPLGPLEPQALVKLWDTEYNVDRDGGWAEVDEEIKKEEET